MAKPFSRRINCLLKKTLSRKVFKFTIENFLKNFNNPNYCTASHGSLLEYLSPNVHGIQKVFTSTPTTLRKQVWNHNSYFGKSYFSDKIFRRIPSSEEDKKKTKISKNSYWCVKQILSNTNCNNRHFHLASSILYFSSR